MKDFLNDDNFFSDVVLSNVNLLPNGHPIQRKVRYQPYTVSGKTRTEIQGNLHKKFACNLCEKRFAHSYSLSRHVAYYHTGELQAQCEICLKMLSSKGVIAKHMLSHKPKSEWPYKCPLCSRRFQAKSDIPKHFLTSAHKGDPRWVIFILFLYKDNLQPYIVIFLILSFLSAMALLTRFFRLNSN
jgi:uncharacterized Zn-finger protein